MKAIRVFLMIAAGVLWVLYAPENFLLRWGSLILLMGVIYILTAVMLGRKAAQSNPLAADPVPSLSLAERALQESRKER